MRLAPLAGTVDPDVRSLLGSGSARVASRDEDMQVVAQIRDQIRSASYARATGCRPPARSCGTWPARS